MKVLVTGGGGFLGGAIVRKLVDRGDQVRSFSRSAYPELHSLGVEQIQGDLADQQAVSKAVAGVDAVIHAAAKPGVWGAYEGYFQANVTGSAHVLDACREHRVSRLVYTSSPSVVFDGEDQNGIDESVPYPTTYLAHYPRTKAMAEKMILEASGEVVATVSLRPHLIWGPGDNHLVPRVLARGRAGKLRLVGDGNNQVDAVYVENAADAHVQALDCLSPGSNLSGKAYFITNDEPWPMVDILNGILAAGDLPGVKKRISPNGAFAAGRILEGFYKITGKKQEPPITRFVARQLATAHWFDISAAKRDFGYQPAISMREGMALLGEHLRANPTA